MPGPKLNNNRKHPHANRQPNQKSASRIGKAEARQEAYDKLSLEQKIARLLPEPHAKKQRARLLALQAKRNQPKQEDSAMVKGDLNMVVADTSPKQNQSKQKRYER